MSDKSRLYGLIRVAATEPPKRLNGETDKEYLDRMIGLLWPPGGAPVTCPWDECPHGVNCVHAGEPKKGSGDDD